MDNPTADRNPLEWLAEEFAERYRHGERPSLTEYTSRYPEHAAEIRELFPALLVMEQLKQRSSDSTGAHAISAPRTHREVPERLGDFRILRYIAEGGMGYVYEAEQESMGRHVALKILKPEILSEKALARFRRESRSAGRLHHTNIVPVFGLGECDGFSYYAMQFIRGEGLDKIIADLRRIRDAAPVAPPRGAAPPEAPTSTLSDALSLGLRRNRFKGEMLIDGLSPTSGVHDENPSGRQPIVDPGGTPREECLGVADPPVSRSGLSGPLCKPYFKSVARVGKQVADALAHAHWHGIHHRDIKPSNLLIDHQGTVWVADFGLAREEGAADLTQGDIIGTFRFMAPERFEGESLPQSDIYSLGLTLYELATLEAAFRDDNPRRMIHRIQNEIPKAPRTLDSAIPRNLETIILKAIDKDPRRRYATAEALAEDLAAFAENREIAARRDRPHEKIARWCRRNPAVAALVASVAALLVAIAVSARIDARRLGRELARSERAEADARGKLWESLHSQAKAGRYSRRIGQRFESLQALADAAKIRTTPELRDEAIACMALPDLKPIKEWVGQPPGTSRVALDGMFERYARMDRGGTISVRRVADDRELFSLPSRGPAHDIFVLGFSPDDRYLAASYNHGPSQLLVVWDLRRRVPVVTDAKNVSGYPATFSPDSRLIAAGDIDRSIVLFELATGRVAQRWASPILPRAFAFRPDGRQIAVAPAGSSLKVQIRAVDSGAILGELKVPVEIAHLAWNPDGKTLAFACNDGKISFWDVATKRQTMVIEASKNFGLVVMFDDKGDLLSSIGWDGSLRLWDTHTGKLLLSMPSSGYAPFRRDGQMLHTMTLDKLGIWQVAAGREYRTLVCDPTLDVRSLQFGSIHPAGQLLAVGSGKGVGVWDLKSGDQIAWLPVGTSTVLFEPSGDLLTRGDDGVHRWPVKMDRSSANTWQIGPPRRLPPPGSGAQMARSRDGRVLAFANKQGGVVLNGDSPDRPISLGPHGDVRYIGVSPDGRWVATGSHNGLRTKIWEARDGAFATELPTELLNRVNFSPDGKWLMTANPCRVWAVGSWREGPRIGGQGLGFAPDGRFLAVETNAGVVRLVDPNSGRDLARLEDPNQDLTESVCFSPDGARMVTIAANSPSIHVWDLKAIRRQLAAMGLEQGFPPETSTLTTSAPPSIAAITVLGADPALLQLPVIVKPSLPDANSYHQRAHQLMRLERWTEAVADLGRAIAGTPDDAHLYLVRARADIGAGKLTQARADLRQAENLNPDSPGVIHDLARFYVTGPPELREAARALPLARRAVESKPDNHVYRNTLGIAHYRLRQLDQAVEVLEANARHEHPILGFDRLFLAMVHHRSGRPEQARAEFARAMSWRELHTDLNPQWAEEFQVLRAEAEQVLKSKSSGTVGL